MGISRTLFNTAIGGLLLAGSLHAPAATADAASEAAANDADATTRTATPTKLDAVEVTGQRDRVAGGQVSTQSQLGVLGDRSVFDTPFSVSSYTDQLIRDQQARDLADVLDNDPSVRSAASRYAESQYFAIRGFPVYSGDVLFAGLPGLVDDREPGIAGIERVDVFKGPSALVNNGATDTAVGGTVNLVPKRAGDAPLNRVTLGYTSDAVGEAQLDAGRRYGANKEFGLRTNLGGRYGDTPIDNQDERAGAGSLGLDYRGERLRASLDGIYQSRRLTAEMSGFNVAPGIAIPKAPDAGSNLFDESTYYKKYDSIGLGQVEYDLTGWLTAFGAYGHRRSAERYKGPYFPTLGTENGDTTVLVIPYIRDDNSDTARLGLRASFATGAVQHRLTLSADGNWDESEGGFGFEDVLATNLYHPIPLAPQVPGYQDPADSYVQSSRRNSIALADVATLFDGRLTLIGGARRQGIASRSADPVSGAEQSAYDSFKVSPAGAALFKLTPAWSVYGNYIEALQTGPSAPLGTASFGTVLPPLPARQIEAGTKYDFRNGGATLAVFRINQPAPGSIVGGVYSGNVEQRNRGVELNLFGTVAHGLRLIGGGSYLDPMQVTTNDPATQGRKAAGTPRVTANLGSEWDLPWVRRLTVTARGIYTSKQYLDADDSRQIPGWARLDLGARYSFVAYGRALTLRGDLQNVTGEDYWASALQGRLAIGAPRTLLVSLATEF